MTNRPTNPKRPESPRARARRELRDSKNMAAYRDEKHALRARVGRSLSSGPATKRLMAMSIEQEAALASSLDGYKQLATMRRAAYREHARSMKIGPEIGGLIGDLAKRFGPKVKVWHNVVDWTVAILIARYGEAPEHWPKQFSGDDERRVRSMLASATPMFEGVTPLGQKSASELRAMHREGPGPNREPPLLLLGVDEPSFDEE